MALPLDPNLTVMVSPYEDPDQTPTRVAGFGACLGALLTGADFSIMITFSLLQPVTAKIYIDMAINFFINQNLNGL
jgi:hypothetical protein